MFHRRTPSNRTEARVEFLGAQDGPPEAALIAALMPTLVGSSAVDRAYLARVGYQPQGAPGVALCLVSCAPDDALLVQRVGETFAAMAGPSAVLDVLFLSREQEDDLRRVCAPFYAPAG